MESLIHLSRRFTDSYARPYERGFVKKLLASRATIVMGKRGIGKTTGLVQLLLHRRASGHGRDSGLFVPADHVNVRSMRLYEIAEWFVGRGGTLLCIDEIHRKPDWAIELKSIYDTFPDLLLVASGSAALQLHGGSADLSRRFLVEKVEGLSFREYIELTANVPIPEVSLSDIAANHVDLASDIVAALRERGHAVLGLFDSFLRCGHYPYSLEEHDEEVFFRRLEQDISTVMDVDLLSSRPELTGKSLAKLSTLLSIIATSAPFTPDMVSLKRLLDIGDERTLKAYLGQLEVAGLARTLPRSRKGLKQLEKPAKIYLDNPNQSFAVAPRRIVDRGSLRETFFLSMVAPHHDVVAHTKADFIVDGELVVEVGGRRKRTHQLAGHPTGLIASDDIEIGVDRRAPLWLFGFLY